MVNKNRGVRPQGRSRLEVISIVYVCGAGGIWQEVQEVQGWRCRRDRAGGAGGTGQEVQEIQGRRHRARGAGGTGQEMQEVQGRRCRWCRAGGAGGPGQEVQEAHEFNEENGPVGKRGTGGR